MAPCIYIFRLPRHCILYLLTGILPEFYKAMHMGLTTSPSHHCFLDTFTHSLFLTLCSSVTILSISAPKNAFLSLVIWLMPVTLAVKRQRQKDYKLRADLGQKKSLSLKKKKKKKQ